MIQKNIGIFIFALAIVGFIDSLYLTIKHYTNTSLICNIFDTCEVVTMSVYSKLMGIPVALLGVLFYVFVMLFALYYVLYKKKCALTIIAIISPLAFILSAWFVYLQFFVLHAICEYCLVSAATATTICILSAYGTVKNFTVEAQSESHDQEIRDNLNQ